MRRALPMVGGGLLAVASAVAFGITTPLVQWLGRGLGPFATAGLLYVGAALFSAPLRRPREAPLRREDSVRILAVAVLGAAIAPASLAWGLQHASGVVASLLLNLEALFTVLLSWALAREPLGGRMTAALTSMLVGGCLLVAANPAGPHGLTWGALAIAGATLAWALDNVVGQSLSERDPASVVLAKASVGAVLSLGLAVLRGEARPTLSAALGLLGCGALGFGASLRLYLRAQRRIGVARTGSIFAMAPFLGALLALALGQPAGGAWTLVAAAAFALGLALHLTEHHEHTHAHGAVEHEHFHRHDDGHHAHAHDGSSAVAHSHVHRHEAVTHSHPHAPDLHHRHEH